MNVILKYIITPDNVPVFFNRSIMHNSVLLNAISAGFVIVSFNFQSNNFLVKCYGGSDSLKINSRIQDETIIRDYLSSGLCFKQIENLEL